MQFNNQRLHAVEMTVTLLLTAEIYVYYCFYVYMCGSL